MKLHFYQCAPEIFQIIHALMVADHDSIPNMVKYLHVIHNQGQVLRIDFD